MVCMDNAKEASEVEIIGSEFLMSWNCKHTVVIWARNYWSWNFQQREWSAFSVRMKISFLTSIARPFESSVVSCLCDSPTLHSQPLYILFIWKIWILLKKLAFASEITHRRNFIILNNNMDLIYILSWFPDPFINSLTFSSLPLPTPIRLRHVRTSIGKSATFTSIFYSLKLFLSLLLMPRVVCTVRNVELWWRWCVLGRVGSKLGQKVTFFMILDRFLHVQNSQES